MIYWKMTLLVLPDSMILHENSEIGEHTIMANLYYDISTGTSISPYIGAGLGVALVHLRFQSPGEARELNYGSAQFAGGPEAGPRTL
jgi:opacity protein-like surface antigen